MKNKITKILAGVMLTAALLVTGAGDCSIFATEESSSASTTTTGTTSSDTTTLSGDSTATGAGSTGTNTIFAGLEEGSAEDISVTNYSVDGSSVGGKIKISFTVSTNSNVSDNYTIGNITSVQPVIQDGFVFETNSDALKVTKVNATSANISYTLTAKSSLTTDYYPVTFAIMYMRNEVVSDTSSQVDTESVNTSSTTKTADSTPTKNVERYITKGFSIKLNAGSEVTDSNTDITMKVSKAPTGTYGQKCKMSFSVKSSKAKILSVTPVISDTFPFDTQGDAYKTVSSKSGSKNLKCSYSFVVRKDVTTGYTSVPFEIIYKKGNKTFSTTRSINISLTGKSSSESSSSTESAKSTPRLMVVGCEEDLDAIYPNDVFKLTVRLKNNAKSTVQNIKVTLAQDEKNFISTNGVGSAYIEKMAAGEEQTVTFDLQADSALTAKAYGITVKTDYEDTKANAFNAEDTLTIPVCLKASLKIDDIEPPYDLYVGMTSDMSFSVTNTGAADLTNVRVVVEGNDLSSEETYVGNITSGNTGYATITLTGNQMTEDDGVCTIKVLYQDSTGAEQEYTEETNIFVSEYIEDTEVYDDTEVTSQGPNWTMIIIVLLVIVAVIVIVIIIVKNNKKKKARLEQELMDDDI